MLAAIKLPGFHFKPDIDVGHFLTFLTLIAGFIWWLYTTIREWRRRSREDARSGALRLLLRMLRERGGMPTSLGTLYTEFSSPAMRERRKAYCRRDFKFKDEATFESAVYRLDWEGKIDFVTADEIVFRVDRNQMAFVPFVPAKADSERIVEIFKQSCIDSAVDVWTLERLARTSMRADPKQTSAVIREMLHDSSPLAQRRASGILQDLLARTAASDATRSA
jgi:hypothetical protein